MNKILTNGPHGLQFLRDTRALAPFLRELCAACAAHYGDRHGCDEGKPVNSPHRATREGTHERV